MNRSARRCSIAALWGSWLAAPCAAQPASNPADQMLRLTEMSLEELSNVEVTSVSRAAQSLVSAPATIYVITGEEIVRSGVLSVPEALRLAPNLLVTQINSQEYQISARGFGGNLEAQNFSNKILILIDGRSVYNPLFSGVAYDAQDVLLDDVERIEVISGPGATLWGPNAMNGVINIITRSAHDSRGTLLRVGAGSYESAASVRYGASFGADHAFRVYAKAFDRGPSELSNGDSAGDRWNRAMTGFRVDLGDPSERDRFTIQGDYQEATENQGAAGDVDFSQADLLGRWVREGDASETRLQVFFDQTDRGQPPTGVAFELDSVDLDFQQMLRAGERHRVVWGVGHRQHDYEIVNTPALSFAPPHRTLELTNVFAQDGIALGERFELTVGIKFEENSFSGWSTLPDLRLSWSPTEHSLAWAAAARAIRAPTPFDVDVEERLNGVLFVTGNPDFRPEQVDAYEIGYRSQPGESVSWALSVFRNEYDNLRTIEPAVGGFLPLRWDNLMGGHTYGAEFWASFQALEWWRISPGVRSLSKRLELDESASGLLGTAQSGNDARLSAYLKSAMAFGRWSIDAMLRHVDELPSPQNPAYTELGVRLAFRASDSLELALSGSNLLDERHSEYALPTAREIPRSFHAEARWAF